MNTGWGNLGFQDFSETMAGVAHDPADWQRLGRHVVRRREHLGLTQGAIAAAGGPSPATQRMIENGTQTSYRGSILRSLERALSWPDGTVDHILAGSEPSVGAGIEGPTLSQLEEAVRAIGANPNRSGPLRQWADSLLEQITRLREAEQQEARERGA